MPNTLPEKPELLTDKQVGVLLACTARSVWKWASQGVLPKPIKIGGSTRWRRTDIEAAIENLAAAKK